MLQGGETIPEPPKQHPPLRQRIGAAATIVVLVFAWIGWVAVALGWGEASDKPLIQALDVLVLTVVFYHAGRSLLGR